MLTTIGIGALTFLACIGVTFLLSFFRTYSRVKDEMSNVKYARFRLEWESSCVTYEVRPYLDKGHFPILMRLLAVNGMREETDGDQRKLVQDKVKAVTIVHENWPKPVANTEET